MGFVQDIAIGIGLAEVEPEDARSQPFPQGFYMQIKVKKKTDTAFVFVINPHTYTLGEPFQSVLTPAENNTVVAEENGIITREITLAGTFGLSPKTVSKGFPVSQGNARMTGNAHFAKLYQFFQRYSDLKKDPAKSHLTTMTFHCLRDNLHFTVVPRSFETPRESRGTRNHYEYRIALTAIGGAQDFKLPKVEGGFNLLKDVNQAINEARAAFAEATNRIDQIKKKVANIQVTMNNAAQLINAVSNFTSTGASLVSYPRKQAVSGAETVARAATQLAMSTSGSSKEAAETLSSFTSLARLEASYNKLLSNPKLFANPPSKIEQAFRGEAGLTDEDITNRTAGADIGSRTRALLGSDGSLGGIVIDTKNGFKGIKVKRTDSIESIAFDNDTTPEALVVINDLRSPYISAGGGPGILKPGDIILVPVSGAATDDQGVATANLTADDALYGVDLAIDKTLYAQGQGTIDIAVNTAAGSTDAELIRGLDNVTQGTQITLSTELGGTAFLPEVGIYRTVGDKGTLEQAIMAAADLQEAILSDPRILDIQSTRVILDNDVLYQEVTPIVTGQRLGTTVSLPFGKASGEGA